MDNLSWIMKIILTGGGLIALAVGIIINNKERNQHKRNTRIVISYSVGFIALILGISWIAWPCWCMRPQADDA